MKVARCTLGECASISPRVYILCLTAPAGLALTLIGPRHRDGGAHYCQCAAQLAKVEQRRMVVRSCAPNGLGVSLQACCPKVLAHSTVSLSVRVHWHTNRVRPGCEALLTNPEARCRTSDSVASLCCRIAPHQRRTPFIACGRSRLPNSCELVHGFIEMVPDESPQGR